MKRLAALALGVAWLAFGGPAEAQNTPKKDDVPKFIKSLSDKDEKGRLSGCTGLYEIGRIKAIYIKDSVDPLIKMVKADDSAKVRAAAVKALGAADPDEYKETVETLIEVLKEDKEGAVKVAAVGALAMLGAKSKDAIPALREAADEAKKAAADAADDKKIAGMAKAMGKAVGGAIKTITAQVKAGAK